MFETSPGGSLGYSDARQPTPSEIFDDLPPGRPAAPVLPPMSDDVAALLSAVSGQAAVPATGLPGGQALADLAGLLQAADLLHRVVLARVADADVRGLAGIEGDRSIGTWLSRQDAEVPSGTLRSARRLTRHPCVGQAVQDRKLSVAHADVISEALGRLRPHLDRPDGLVDGQPGEETVRAVIVDGVLSLATEALGGVDDSDPRVLALHAELSELAFAPLSQAARLEAAAVLLAGALPPGTPASVLRDAMDVLTGALLPNLLEQQARDAERDGQLSLEPHADGRPGGRLSADLDPECYELLHTVLTAAAETDPDNPRDTEAWRQAREAGWDVGYPLPTELTSPCVAVRSRGQRAHDALRLALRRLLDSAALGSRAKAAPHVAAIVGLGTLNGDPGALPARGGSGQILPLSLVKQWWADAYVTRYVLGLGHRVVESSHTERTLKAHERRIKIVETGGQCQGAGCVRGPGGPVPGSRLVPHHPDAFCRTGTTSVGNSPLFCEHTHAELHRGATITLKDGRRLNADGWLD